MKTIVIYGLSEQLGGVETIVLSLVNKLADRINFIIVLSALITFGGSKNFSVDSYIILFGFKNGAGIESAMTNISSLRFTTGLLVAFFSWINYSPIPNSTLSIVLFSLLVAIPLSFVVKEVYGRFGLEKFSIIRFAIVDISFLILSINVAVGSQLSFPECIIACGLGFCFSYCAVLLICKKGNILKSVGAVILIAGATGCYQQFLSIIATSLIILFIVEYIGLTKQKAKGAAKCFIKPAIIFIIGGVLYAAVALALLKIFNLQVNERANFSSISGIIDNVLYVIKHQRRFLTWNYVFSTEILFITSIIAFAIWFFSWIRYTFKHVGPGIFVAGGYSNSMGLRLHSSLFRARWWYAGCNGRFFDIPTVHNRCCCTTYCM